MKKVLFVLPFFRGGIRKISSEHLNLVLKLSRIHSVFLIAFSNTEYEINLELNDNIKIIDLNSRLLTENHFDLTFFTRVIDFDFIKNVKTEKLVLDLHFLNKVWTRKMRLNEVIDGSFYRAFQTFDKGDHTRFMISCLDKVKEELKVLKRCDLIFANSQNTLDEVLKLDLKAESVLAQVSSVLFADNFIDQSDGGFCCLADPSDWRRGVHRVFNNGLNVKFWGLEEVNRELILEEASFGPWLESKEELFNVLRDKEYILFPSLYESFGLLLQECMSSGKVCFVQKDNPGFDEQVEDKVNGFKIDFSVDGWETDILKLIDENKSKMIHVKEEAILSSRRFSKLNRHKVIEQKIFTLLE